MVAFYSFAERIRCLYYGSQIVAHCALYPFREKRMKFENETPITEMHEALRLLVRPWGESSWRELLLYEKPPYIKVTWVRDDHGHDWNLSEYFLVTLEIVAELHEKLFVEGTPHMGYTDEKELRITQRGTEAFFAEENLRREINERERKAQHLAEEQARNRLVDDAHKRRTTPHQ